jgi:hypothetical protein
MPVAQLLEGSQANAPAKALESSVMPIMSIANRFIGFTAYDYAASV